MPTDLAVEKVRAVLQRFQDGYTQRDLSKLDEFMKLFAIGEEIEMIGIGASARGGYEWFQGPNQIREIIEGDWTYWGDVLLDMAGARITVRGEVAWLSTTGQVVQSHTMEKAFEAYLAQMKDLVEKEDQAIEVRLMEATHFGLRRLREWYKGEGYGWPFVLTAILIKSGRSWRFHTLHWSMPVD